jgi:NodT family efflux transporter outer membrane factor (OMF) lipoprotein
MYKTIKKRALLVPIIVLGMAACKIPAVVQPSHTLAAPPKTFGTAAQDTVSSGSLPWRKLFNDPQLLNLIDTALKNNQELLITLQDVEIARNSIMMRSGALRPSVAVRAGAGVEKVGRYTSQGAGDATTEIEPGKEMPDPLPDFGAAAVAHWEVDIWKKLRNEKQAAVAHYLATAEGKNFVLTNLVAEVANLYYELLALDNQLAIVRENISLQKNALEIVKAQKESGRATELAVQKFQAEVLNSEGLEFETLQRIRETENSMNLLLGRYPQAIVRDQNSFYTAPLPAVSTGLPSQLLTNRPDIRGAEQELAAARLDVQAARKAFYPSLDISAAIGLQAFNPAYLARMPESLLYNIAGDLAGPLINRNAIKADFQNANARQLQALYEYDRSVLNAYFEVATQQSNLENLGKRYALKAKEVEAMNRSNAIANDLFSSARVDYLEVLMTQRDALESKLELVETRKAQLGAVVTMYRNLGGGWQ